MTMLAYKNYKRGNFLVITLLIGLMVLGGIGASQLLVKQGELTKHITTQSDAASTAAQVLTNVASEEARVAIADNIYTYISDKDSGYGDKLTSDIKTNMTTYFYDNFIGRGSIHAEKSENSDVKITSIDSGNDTHLQRFVPGSFIFMNSAVNAISKDFTFGVDGISVDATTVTTNAKTSKSAGINYALIPNANLSWYHAISANSSESDGPDLKNVTFTSPEEDDMVVFFPKLPLYANSSISSEQLKPMLRQTSIIMTDFAPQGVSGIYDYRRMSDVHGSVYDYLLYTPKSNTGMSSVANASRNYNRTGNFWKIPHLPDNIKLRSFQVNVVRELNFNEDYTPDTNDGGFVWTEEGSNKANALQLFDVDNQKAVTLRYPMYGRGNDPLITIKKPEQDPDATPDNSPVMDAISPDLKEFFDALSPVLRERNEGYILDIDENVNYSARVESVALFLGILYDVSRNASVGGMRPIQQVLRGVRVRDILHPHFVNKLSGKSGSKYLDETIYNFIEILNTNDISIPYFPENWDKIHSYMYDNLATSSYGIADVTLYPAGSDLPIFGPYYRDNDLTIGLVRFPWVSKDMCYILVSGIPEDTALSLYATKPDMEKVGVYVSGKFASTSGNATTAWHEADPAMNSGLITNLPVYLSAKFNKGGNTTFIASPVQLNLIYPQYARKVVNNESQVSLNANEPIFQNWTAGAGESVCSDVEGYIADYTINNDRSPFYVVNDSLRNTMHPSAVNIGHAQVDCDVIVCVYDRSKVTDPENVKCKLSTGEKSMGEFANVFIPAGTSGDEIATLIEKNAKVNVSKNFKTAGALTEAVMKSLYTDAFKSQVKNHFSGGANVSNEYGLEVLRFSKSYSPLKESAKALQEKLKEPLVKGNNPVFFVGWCDDLAGKSEDTVAPVSLGEVKPY